MQMHVGDDVQAAHQHQPSSPSAILLNGFFLQVSEQTPGVYVPQVGDKVVYLQQGHKLYLERLRDKRRGPWDAIISTAVRHTACLATPCPAMSRHDPSLKTFILLANTATLELLGTPCLLIASGALPILASGSA